MTCEWNPKTNKAALTTDEFHGNAVWSVGSYANNWHLCPNCIELLKFKKFKRRLISRKQTKNSND